MKDESHNGCASSSQSIFHDLPLHTDGFFYHALRLFTSSSFPLQEFLQRFEEYFSAMQPWRKLSQMRLKALHALQQLLYAGPCRLALIVAYRLTATLAGVALFLGHLAHGFHRVAVLFCVFTVALRDEPSNLRRISPLLGMLCPVLGL
jgi:hypothetical protein